MTPQKGKILNEKGEVLFSKVEIANNFFTRFKGLMGRPGLSPGEGLLIHPCNSVHCFFMKFPIDLLFLSSNGTVVGMETRVNPWRISGYYRQAVMVLEIGEGQIEALSIKLDDRLILPPF